MLFRGYGGVIIAPEYSRQYGDEKLSNRQYGLQCIRLVKELSPNGRAEP
jgi:hypothetical protein